ncbi:MAG: hypothetical protein ACTHNS_09125 [Marmoricola sp.]
MNTTLTRGSLLLTAALLGLATITPATTAEATSTAATTTPATHTRATPSTVAGSARVADPHDLAHGVDLRSVAVRHAGSRLVVTTTHADLRRDPATGSGGAVYLDTDPGRPGPEFVLVGGYYAGTDYQLLHTEGFGRHAWGRPVDGSYRMSVDYGRDTVRTSIARAALGRPAAVRVAVRVSGTRADGHPAGVDWLGAPRSLTPWVTRA